jgi:hypothetical protein
VIILPESACGSEALASAREDNANNDRNIAAAKRIIALEYIIVAMVAPPCVRLAIVTMIASTS